MRKRCTLQGEGIRTVMGDPHETRRNKDKQCPVTRQTLNSAKRAVKSKSGKTLLRKRGEHVERSFAHILDHGGLRRATLRGTENLTKRQIAAAMTYDLSLLMRKVFGFGTPKQWAAKSFLWVLSLRERLIGPLTGVHEIDQSILLEKTRGKHPIRRPSHHSTRLLADHKNCCFSTGC